MKSQCHTVTDWDVSLWFALLGVLLGFIGAFLLMILVTTAGKVGSEASRLLGERCGLPFGFCPLATVRQINAILL